MSELRAEYYFALPRLIATLRGKNAVRSENNWLEANIVGGMIYLLTFATVGPFILAGRTFGRQLLLLVPAVFLTWIFWLLAIYLTALVLRLLRAIGVMRDLPTNHAQSILVSTLVTIMAWRLVLRGSWPALLGLVWIGAVLLNFLAAMLLTISAADDPAGH